MFQIDNYTGVQKSSVSIHQQLESFLVDVYQPGLVEEFNTMEALITSFTNEDIKGGKKFKKFSLGITDNLRAIGGVAKPSDTYKIDLDDFQPGADFVEAEFDTTKLIGVFSITDEVLTKGTGDGSIVDILDDNLRRMQVGLKHTYQRYSYGASTGDIGVITTKAAVPLTISPYNLTEMGPRLIATFTMTNSYSLLQGMGITVKIAKLFDGTSYVLYDPESDAFKTAYKALEDSNKAKCGSIIFTGRIWQKDNSKPGKDDVIAAIDYVKDTAEGTTPTEIPYKAGETVARVYSRQISKEGIIGKEYTGLQDIVIKQNNKLFGINRSQFPSFNCPQKDLENTVISSEVLRDMADHITLTAPDGANANLVISTHRIISTIENQLNTQLQYSGDAGQNGYQLGRPTIKFDSLELKKDKYSRDKNVYLLNTSKIHKLVRDDLRWLTSGRETILERIPNSETYEGIMREYSDMSVDSFRDHASFINAKDSLE